MKKILITLVWGVSAVFSHAMERSSLLGDEGQRAPALLEPKQANEIASMDKNGPAPRELYISGATIEYDRKQCKDYPYHDITYATIPLLELIINMNAQDPFTKMPLHELEKKDIPSIARVVTEKRVYYCGISGLHEKLMLENLPSLSTLKDPLDNSAALCGLDYYGYFECGRCQKCLQGEHEIKQAVKEFVCNPSKGLPHHKPMGCQNVVMSHIGCYEDFRDFINILQQNKDLMNAVGGKDTLNDLGIRSQGKSIVAQKIQENKEPANLLIKCAYSIIGFLRHIGQAESDYNSRNYNSALKKLESAKECISEFEQWTLEHNVKKNHYRMVNHCKIMLVGLKGMMTLAEIDTNAALIPDAAARGAYMVQRKKEYMDRI